ncbi:peptidase domain-containing ABC transporter [Flaviaesturariibacter amylovorans]|uniref:ATP-binding cassette domain-containing protein n=1 Tax=Flaviaesturariibacter amylovorans TaxID=1084520 RepID=A0ABP8GS13_9BACT
MVTKPGPAARIWNLLREERSDITPIYVYATLNGLIQLSLPVGIQSIIGFVLAGTLSASLVLLISLIVTGVLLVGALQIGQMRAIEKIQQRLFVRYAHAFATRIPRLDLQKADGVYLPELVNRFFETVSLQKGFSKLLLDLPTALIQILFGLILLSFYHPSFILFGIVLVLLLWAILWATGESGLHSSLEESRHKYAVASWFEELARVVKPFKFASGGLHLRKADEHTVRYLGSRTRHFRVLLAQYRTLVVFKVGITAAMLIVGVVLLLRQQINIGQFVAAEIIILTVINAIEKIIINLDSVYDILTAVEKISKLTDKPVEASGTYMPDPGQGFRVEASGLRFGYEGRQVLNGLSFRVEAGEKACLLGPEGAGRSTLLKLLAGLYPRYNGALTINGVPLGNYDLPALRQHLGIFLQHEQVFHGTLWENLTMGREVDRAYLQQLIAETGLQSFVQSLPEGYDTELDPTGRRLAGHVVQKILLVRALAHRPRLLLLEEPWRGIEEPYKSRIRSLLLGLEGTTVVLSTADPEFTARAQRVIQL